MISRSDGEGRCVLNRVWDEVSWSSCSDYVPVTIAPCIYRPRSRSSKSLTKTLPSRLSLSLLPWIGGRVPQSARTASPVTFHHQLSNQKHLICAPGILGSTSAFES